MVIWLHAREEFVDNRFQLLLIYIDFIVLLAGCIFTTFQAMLT